LLFYEKGTQIYQKSVWLTQPLIKSVDKRSIKEKVGILSKKRMDKVHEGLKILMGMP
jgi:hypothetical protein